MGATGYTLSSWIGLGFYFVSASGSTSSFAWRFPLAFQAVPAILLLIGSPWLPFSPRWLAEQDRFDEAETVLKRLHARKGELNHEQARKELFQIREQLKLDREIGKNASRFEIFKTGPNRKRLLVTVILTWGAIFTGPLVIASYGVILFIQLGISGFMPIVLLGIWTTVAIPGNLISAFYIDRVGRRTFLLIGAIGLLVTLIFECALQARYTGTTNRSGQIAAIFFIYVFIVIYTVFIDATQWVYLSEIYPTHIRGLGVGIGLFNWFGSSVILQVAGPIALDNIGWKFFFVLIIPTAFYAVGIYL
jgi:MFS family permease